MSDRLPSGVLVGALLRRVNDAGGIGAVLARGDAQAGAILIVTCEKGRDFKVFEREIGPDGATRLNPTTIAKGAEIGDESQAVTTYWQRRRDRDPDLWVIELDIPEAERFAAETIAVG